ncbi:hypothetical protein, conserved [Leishmania tarentolae]|uniref:protein-serine/threonine phosphatase n=1 Tax=Leishmania tarentolae TaxID=5689 RepID=A0A640K994_LEITA|nr:hypothetical protein, conserved [Leishmania tarentolae]
MAQPRLTLIPSLVDAAVGFGAARAPASNATESEETRLTTALVMAKSTAKPFPTRTADAVPSTPCCTDVCSLSYGPAWGTPVPHEECNPCRPPAVAAADCACHEATQCTQGCNNGGTRCQCRPPPPSLQAANTTTETMAHACGSAENLDNAACLVHDEGVCRGSHRPYLNPRPLTPMSPSSAAIFAISAASVRGPGWSSPPTVNAELVDRDHLEDACATSCANEAAPPLAILSSPSNNADTPAVMAPVPLSNTLAGAAATAHESCYPPTVSPSATHDAAIAAIGPGGSPTHSSYFFRGTALHLLDTGASEGPCWQADFEDRRGFARKAAVSRQLKRVTRACSTDEEVDSVSVPVIAGTQLKESAACPRSPDVPVGDVLSTINSPKAEDLARGRAGEHVNANDNNVDGNARAHVSIFRALSLPQGLMGDDARPCTRRTEAWPSALRTRERTGNAVDAPASPGRMAQETDSNKRAPSLVLQSILAQSLSAGGMQLGGSLDEDRVAHAASAASTPLLPLCASASSGSGVLVHGQPRTEPLEKERMTPIKVAAAASATSRRRCATHGTPLLDSFHPALSPCPSSIAPPFFLVPCLSTSRVSSPVSVPARIASPQWRDQALTRTRIDVGGGCTCPLTSATSALDSVGRHASYAQRPPHPDHAVSSLLCGSTVADGDWEAASGTPPNDWALSPSRRSGGRGDTTEVAVPMGLDLFCLGGMASPLKDVPEVRQGHANSSLQDAPVCRSAGTDGGRNCAATLSLRLSCPQPSCTSLNATPPPAHEMQKHPGSPHNPPASASPTAQSLPPVAPAAHTSSPFSLPRQAESPGLLCTGHVPRGGAGSSDVPPWLPMSLRTAHHHDSGFHTSPTDAPCHSSNSGRLHAQPFVSASSSQCPHQSSAVVNSSPSSSAYAESQPRTWLHHPSMHFEPLCAPGDAALMRRSLPPPSESFVDFASRCAVHGSTVMADTSLTGMDGAGLFSLCSTPPPSPTAAPLPPSRSVLSQRMSGGTSSLKGDDVCLWNVPLASSRGVTLASISLPCGSPLARATRTSTTSSWAPSLCTSPTTGTDMGGLGSKGGAEPTCIWGRGPHRCAAPHTVPVDGDGFTNFGVEAELCRLQRVPNAHSSSSMSLSSAAPASTKVVVGGSQKAALCARHIDRESGGAGSNDLGSGSVYMPAALQLVPPPPLVTLSADHCPLSRTSLRSGNSLPSAAASRTSVTGTAASAQRISSLQCLSPVRCTREGNTVLAVSAPTSEDVAEGREVVATVERGNTQTVAWAALAAPPDVTATATEGAPPLSPTPMPSASPAKQFQCAFSSLRGCRSRQEDSVMMVVDLPVRMWRGITTAVPSVTVDAASASTSTAEAGRASVRREVGEMRKNTAGTNADSALAQEEEEEAEAAHHTTDVRGKVAFACFGIFDGHCGDTVASLASQFFPEHFEHAMKAYQKRLKQDQRTSGGAAWGAGSSAPLEKENHGKHCECVEEPLAEQLPSPQDTAPTGAVEFQRVVSAALVQALVHLDLTLYDLLHDSTHSLSARRRDAGSTASVAAIFKVPTTSALYHSGAEAVVDSGTNSNPPLVAGDGDAPSSSRGPATTRTPATLAEPGKHVVHGGGSTSPTPAARTEDTYRLCIANLGDSRAIIGNLETGELLLSTTDHRISAYPSEAARIHAAGGVVEFGRVDGRLDVTRGLGDYQYKVAPAQWWSSVAPAPASVVPANVSSAPVEASGAATNATTTAIRTAMGKGSFTTATATSSSPPMKVAEGSVEPAGTPRRSNASEGGFAVRALRWQSWSSTSRQSPMSEDMDGGGAATVNAPGSSNLPYPDDEAKLLPAPLSQGPRSSGAAETGGAAHTREEEHPLRVPSPSLSLISPSSPFSSWSPLASASAVTLTHNAVSNIADVYEWEVGRGEVLIMASDGVWDRMTSEDVLAFVRHELEAAQQQAKSSATRIMHGDGAAVEVSNETGMGTSVLPEADGVDADALSATEVEPLSLSEALESTPLRQRSPCQEQECASARFLPAAPLCTPGGIEAAAHTQHDDHVDDLLAGTTGGAPCTFAVQKAARRLVEHVVHNLFGSDNTSVVVVTFD